MANEPGLLFARSSSLRHHDRRLGQYEFLAFLATTLFINSLVQAFFMPNIEEFSELMRTGGLDFALLKPIDTQFLVSLHNGRLVEPGRISVCADTAGVCAGPLARLAGRRAGRALSAVRCCAAWRFSTA